MNAILLYSYVSLKDNPRRCGERPPCVTPRIAVALAGNLLAYGSCRLPDRGPTMGRTLMKSVRRLLKLDPVPAAVVPQCRTDMLLLQLFAAGVGDSSSSAGLVAVVPDCLDADAYT